jgi:hypothetical protein
MRTTSMRLVAAVVVTSMAVVGAGPLAHAQAVNPATEATPLEQSEPTLAQAQPSTPPAEQTPPVPPPAPVLMAPPAPPPMPPAAASQPAQPDLFQETLKAEQRRAERKHGMYTAGAVVTNVFLVPGRAITCALGATLGVLVLAATFGTQYKTAAGAMDEGCGGKWIVNGDDLKPEGSGRGFEWER